MNPPKPVTLDYKTIARVLASPERWLLLGELARGEALPVAELARRAGTSRVQCSKNMILLRGLGLAEQGWGRLYRLPEALMPAPGSRDIKLGACTLHFPA